MGKYIVLLVGKSGSGKSTIAKELTDTYGLKELKSYTTRPKRNKDDNSHEFITNDEFDKLKDIVAYTEFDGHRYAGTSEQVDNSDIYIIDPSGIDYFMSEYTGKKIPLVVYICCDEVSRYERMLGRGDNVDDVVRRMEQDNEIFKNVKDFAYSTYFNDKPSDISEIAMSIYNFIFSEGDFV